MKKFFTRAIFSILVFSAFQASAATKIYTCGDLYLSGRCDERECLVSIKIESEQAPRERYIFIQGLDGQLIETRKDVLALGLHKKVGQMICVSGEIINDEVIPDAQTEYLN